MTREQQPNATQKKFEDIVKQSDLVNQTVYDSDTMDELGRVEVLWMFPQVNRVLGFVCRSGLLGRQKTAFKLSQLVAVGKNSVLVSGDGEPTVTEKVQKLESLVHREVWSDAGEQVGYITDCLFNYRSGVIVRYLMAKRRFNTFTDDIFFLPPKAIKSFGSQRVLVDQDVVPTLKPYRHGLKSRLALARETVQTEYIDEWKAEFQTLVQQMQTFSQGALRKVEQLSDRLRQETRTFVEQAKSSGQTFAEQLRTEGQTLGQTFSESFQEFTTRTETERSHASDDDLDDQVISKSAVSTDVDLVWDDQWEDELDELEDLEDLDEWGDHDSSSAASRPDLSAPRPDVQVQSEPELEPDSQMPDASKPNSAHAAPAAQSTAWQAGDDPWDDLWDDEFSPEETASEHGDAAHVETSAETAHPLDPSEAQPSASQPSSSAAVDPAVDSPAAHSDDKENDRPSDDPWI